MTALWNAVHDRALGAGFSVGWADAFSSAACVLAVLVAGYAVASVLSLIAGRFMTAKAISSSHRTKVLSFVGVSKWFIFAWISSSFLPDALRAFPSAALVVRLLAEIFAIIMCASALSSAITCLRSAAKSKLKSEVFASKTFSQMLKILVWFTAAIVVVSALMGKSPAFVLSGLGALTAVLMLIFRDSLLGLVAGIQVSQNDMVRLGDWITMPKFNADGNVIDIALTTVKVQNFDNTVTMIPSSALISDSFINWRYMSTSKGRRIKRPVWISVTSIRELSAGQREKLVAEGLLRDGDNPVSNLAAFEMWLRRMLAANGDITQELTCMVRQTEAGDTGIPVEVYAFTKTRDWVEYEMIQTDIFDRIFVTVPKFSLQVYQRTGDKLA